MPDSFSDLQKRTLKKRLTNLHEDYKAANNQLSHALSDVERIRLQRIIDDLEREIQQVESKLGRVKTSGVSTILQSVSPEPPDSAQGAGVSGIKKLLNDWKWIAGTLIAVVGCIGTWLTVPGIFTFFQSTTTATSTAISTVVGTTPNVTPQPISEPFDTPTSALPPTATLVSTTAVVAVPTQTPISESKDEPIIFEVCPTNRETGEIVPSATVDIKVKGEAEFKVIPKENGCTEFVFNSFYKGESGLLTVSADGFKTYQKYVDIVDENVVYVELERLPAPTPTNSPSSLVSPTPRVEETKEITNSGTITSTPELLPAPELLKPIAGETVYAYGDGRTPAKFHWYWKGELPSGTTFEVRIWNKDLDPISLGTYDVRRIGYRPVRVIYEGGGNYSVSFRLAEAAGYRQAVTNYLWTVAIVRVEPYERIGLEPEPRPINIQYVPPLPK